jgi:pimeloyl-ACP methyl ester carboxylesterase
MPISGIALKENAFHFDVKSVGGAYDGKVDEKRALIKGTWRQGPGELPLDWKRVDKPSALNRPQNPVKPYPYREQEVKYPNSQAAGVELAGTLTFPNTAGPFPAVLFISGSGPQDRDETLLGHKPFLVLADYLTRKGFAVLRFDDRGSYKSTGNYGAATSADFATDAEAGIAYLKTRSEVDAKKIGLLGHSEGALIAPMVAARSRDVAFLVLIAAPGERGRELLARQARLVLKANGKPEAEIVKAESAQKQIFELLCTEKDESLLREKLGKLVPAGQVNALLSPWLRYFLEYDPLPALTHVTVPVLALNGSVDLQVEPKSNLAGVRSALAKAGNTNARIVELPGLNHLLQKSASGAVSEYAQLEETINPVALDTIGAWLLATTRQ